MTSEQWAALVRRLEPEAREDPKGYGRKVALFGALGYAFIALSLVVLVLLAVLVIAGALAGPALLLKLLIPIGALGLLIIRSLSVKMDPPDGLELKPDDAPELHRMIDEVNETVQGPKVHTVLVNEEPNAAIVQIPRRGAIFGQRNYLVLGLPYMQAMSPDEFRAVVAHELGHLSRSHGRFGTWIYRIRATWWQLLSALEQKRHWTTGVFRRFFEWYVPRFDAYSFPLRRAHEFEADEAAAAAAGPQAAMTALLSGTIGARYLYETYWPGLYRRADVEREPPRSAFAPMSSELATARAGENVESMLQEELRREPDVADTHPSLGERIEHLGLDPQEIVRLVTSNGRGQTAAQVFLGEAEAALAEQFDEAWRESVREAWREQHEARVEQRNLLEDLERRENLDVDDGRTLAELSAEFRDEDTALQRYRAVLAREPNDAQSNFAVGSILLSRGDDGGLAHLDKAMAADHEAVLPACEAAIEYLQARGRTDEADRYRQRGEQQLDVYEAATAERSVEVDDEFEPARLDGELVERIRSVLSVFPEVRSAYLVRKRLEHLADEEPLYVIALIPKNRWRQLWKDADAEEKENLPLPERFADALELPIDFEVIVPGPRAGMDERLEAIEGSKVFSRD